jgi:hypothetical protein
MFDVQQPPPLLPPRPHPPLHHDCSHLSSQRSPSTPPPKASAPGTASWPEITCEFPGTSTTACPFNQSIDIPGTPLRFYSHHPPLMPLTIALSYKIFGQKATGKPASPPPSAPSAQFFSCIVILKDNKPQCRPLCIGHLCIAADHVLLRRPTGIPQSPIRLPPPAQQRRLF